MMGSEEKKKRPELSAYRGRWTAFSDKEMIVLRGGCSVTLYGCRRILLYSPCEIRVRVGKRTVSVRGCGLACTCFSAGSVTVKGIVRGVEYCDGERNDLSERSGGRA